MNHMQTFDTRLIQHRSMFTDSNLLFSHHDISETCREVGQIFKPHALTISKKNKNFSASMHHIQKGALSLSRLEYGADVIIEPNHLDQFYLIQVPMGGYAEIEFAKQRFISYNNVASLISPDQAVRMQWHANSPQLILKINKQEFLQHCKQHLPDINSKGIVFDPRLDLSTQGGSYFLQLLSTVMDALDHEQHPLHHPMAFKQFESSLFNALIYGQPNDALHQINATAEKTISPYFVKRTEEYIRANLHEALNIEMMAEQAGVSVRTLFSGFKTYLNTTPMHYLRELRFEQVHEELMRNDQLSVTDVAFKWGFTHLGRFSQEYKQRYGELPSMTRRHVQNQIHIMATKHS